jgi:hypothetical protein
LWKKGYSEKIPGAESVLVVKANAVHLSSSIELKTSGNENEVRARTNLDPGPFVSNNIDGGWTCIRDQDALVAPNRTKTAQS